MAIRETRLPLLAAVADGSGGTLPASQSGLQVSRPGVLVTAFGPDPDGNPGTLLRVWEQAGMSDPADRRASSKAGQARLAFALRQAESRLKPLRIVSRGYAGWLMTCKRFLDEHDALFSRWSGMVLRWGLDKPGILLPKEMFLPGSDPTGDPKWSDYSKEFEEFFTRWRLQGMAAPYLPLPLRPLMAGMLATSLLPQLNRAGGVFCLCTLRMDT